MLYMEEVHALEAQAPNGRLQDLPPFDIIVQYLPDSGIIKTDKLRNCQFSENPASGKRATPGRR